MTLQVAAAIEEMPTTVRNSVGQIGQVNGAVAAVPSHADRSAFKSLDLSGMDELHAQAAFQVYAREYNVAFTRYRGAVERGF